MLKLNETPVKTSRNFKINNIIIEDFELPENISEFKNLEVIGQNSKIKIDENTSKANLIFGLGNVLTNQVNANSNQKIKIDVDSKTDKELQLNFKLDKNNPQLVDNIEIVANENSKSAIIIKYESEEVVEAFHNGIINLKADKNSKVNVIIVNLLNNKSNNFLSIQNELEDNAIVEYTIVDFGGKTSITNYYSNLIGDNSKSNLNTLYIGKENQLIDLNYIGELRGKNSDVNIEVQGALKDNSKKHFKGTIDFKKGCKKAKGRENENCMLLSDTAKSIALPMLLCSEEDVEGEHSTSAGKVGEKELFYIMSRGFELKEALKLMIRANFNSILENIRNEELKNQIIEEMEKRLD